MSERRRYLIEVEMDTVNLTGNGEWCSVRIPSNGPCVLPVRFRDLRDAPDDGQLRRERDAWKRCAKSWEDCSKELERERGEFRDRVAELERKMKSARHATETFRHMLQGAEKRAQQTRRERDEARREAEELRQEWHRLRHELEEAASIAANQPVFAGDIIGKQSVKSLVSRGIVRKNRDGDYVLRTPGPEHSAPHDTHCVPVRVTSQLTNVPAPQTHFFKPGDVVLSKMTDKEYRMGQVIRWNPVTGEEIWTSPDSSSASGRFNPAEDTLLERDGTPTDAGLRRLAEKAGLTLRLGDARGLGAWESDAAYLSFHATASDRRALAAALREMGGVGDAVACRGRAGGRFAAPGGAESEER